MKLYVVTDQGIDYIDKPLSELLTSQGMTVRPQDLKERSVLLLLTDNCFLEIHQRHSTLKDAKQYIRYRACFTYNFRDGRINALTVSWCDYPEGGKGKWGCEFENFHIEFIEEEHELLKKFIRRKWMKFLCIRLSYVFWHNLSRITSK